MSDLPIKATFKSGAGYDAPWLTIDAADPNDLSFKLDAILGGDALAKVISVAELFKAANNAGPLVAPGVDPLPSQPAQQQQPSGWSNSPAQTQPQWSQQPQPQQQQAAPQGGGGNRPGAQLHPEGKACGECGTTLEYKKTQSGKAKWQCPQWRWNNGNPNGHTADWVN